MLTCLLGRVEGHVVKHDEEDADQRNVEHEQSDQMLEGSDVEEGHDEEDFEVGDAVWGLRHGKRLPAVVVRLDDIPQSRQKQIKSAALHIFQ